VDRASKFIQISTALRSATLELEIVNRLKRPDGSSSEITNIRRMVCKKIARKGIRTVLSLADIDREALKQQFPFETFTVADFPELFVDHVNRRIPQGVGQVVKVPLTWIGKSGGVWTYAGPKVLAGVAGTLQTVYRGTQPEQGSIVAATEYTTGRITGTATGVEVNTVQFTHEQIGFDGQPYVLDADYLLPGSRAAADEIVRILGLYGIATDAASFNAAAAYDNANGFAIDALYGGKTDGKAGNAIVEDHLRAARAWMIQTATSAWALIQDTPKASTLQVDTSIDRVVIDEYSDPDTINETITVQYRPKASTGEEFLGKLQRVTSGANGERVVSLPYTRDHLVADRIGSYLKKREVKKIASGYATGIQRNAGDVLTIADANTILGTKDFIHTAVSRPADRNDWKLREYDADVYVYSAPDPSIGETALPADATTGYAPDYSFTPPLAPTGLVVVSQGASVADDGTMTSFALVRATPPAANWQRLMAMVTNTVTGEIYQAQLILTGGNYEARVTGMRPNVLHNVVAWAVNANNIDGSATAAVTFTTTTFSTSPSTPTGLVVVSQGTVTDANGVVRAYALIRATPPALYFRRLMAQVKNTTTGAVVQAQLVLNAGNYECQFDGLLPNQAHQVIAWAVNFENTDGGVTAPVSFTSATNASVPAAPGAPQIGQRQSLEVVYSWGKVTPGAGAPPIVAYVVEKQVGAGAFNEIWRGDGQMLVDTSVATGITYTMRVKARDQYGNESAYATSSGYTVQKMIDGSYIISQGVDSNSLANTSVSQNKVNLTSWSASGTIAAGSSSGLTVGGNANLNFLPNIAGGGITLGAGGGIAPGFNLINTLGSSTSWSASALTLSP
jgi:hypothetical protein